jgi:hypothetical protein
MLSHLQREYQYRVLLLFCALWLTLIASIQPRKRRQPKVAFFNLLPPELTLEIAKYSEAPSLMLVNKAFNTTWFAAELTSANLGEPNNRHTCVDLLIARPIDWMHPREQQRWADLVLKIANAPPNEPWRVDMTVSLSAKFLTGPQASETVLNMPPALRTVLQSVIVHGNDQVLDPAAVFGVFQHTRVPRVFFACRSTFLSRGRFVLPPCPLQAQRQQEEGGDGGGGGAGVEFAEFELDAEPSTPIPPRFCVELVKSIGVGNIDNANFTLSHKLFPPRTR